METPTLRPESSSPSPPAACEPTPKDVERLRQRIYSTGSDNDSIYRAHTACSALLDQAYGMCSITDYFTAPKELICSALDKCASSTKSTEMDGTPPVSRSNDETTATDVAVSSAKHKLSSADDALSSLPLTSTSGDFPLVQETTPVTEEASEAGTAVEQETALVDLKSVDDKTTATTPSPATESAGTASPVAPLASEAPEVAAAPPEVPSSARFLAALTAEQRAAIERARAVFVDAGGVVDPCTDVFLARFCVGNKWHPTKTEAHLRRTLAWRASSNANKYRAAAVAGTTLLEFEEVRRFLSVATGVQQMGTTYAGDAVDYITVGNISARRFLTELDSACYFEGNLIISELQYYHFDRLTLLRGDGRLVKMFSVFDLDGLRMEHISFKMQARLKTTAPLHDLYYPEIMATACLINVPSFFANFWLLFGRVFSKEKRDAVQIHAKGKADVLTKSIPKEWVPACYGGELRQLPPQTMRALGFATLPDAMLPQLLPGPTKWLGHFIMPEAQAQALAAAEN